MAALIRAFDWSTTPIGAPEDWSPALRTTVQILLANRFPLLLWWGPEYISIYNDAYRPILGRKHPWALGKPVRSCWSEIWHVLQPLIDTPFSGGPATWSEDIELQINRDGFTEETHFTIAYSPVPDETAERRIGGVLATVHEITQNIVGERRVLVLRDLGTRSAESKEAEEACLAAAETLASHPKDVPFAMLYLLDAAGKKARLAASAGVELGSSFSPPVVDLDRPPGQELWPLALARQTGRMQIVEKLHSKFGSAPRGPWPDPPDSAAVLPVRSRVGHTCAGFFIAGLSSRLKLDDGYVDFLELATSQIAAAIGNAQAHEEERKRVDALAEIDRAKTVFFSNVSHEFRTPLTLLLGPIEEMLRDPSPLDPAGRDRLKMAHRNALRLLKLVNSLLDFSRIEAGRMNASYVPVDLSAITADVASNFTSVMKSAGLDFTVDCPPLPERVYVDPQMWEKIVLNLLSNAFKFTFQGSVKVSLEAIENRAVLSIEDTGTGIPEAEIPHIFTRFHRVEGVKGRTYEGTGIGLALIQELVKLHGGTIGAASRPGHGSVFRVSIPFGAAHIAEDRIDRAKSPSTPAFPWKQAYTEEARSWLPHVASPIAGRTEPAHGEKTKRPRILVVDDNTDMRDHITRTLGSEYQVIESRDGEAALAAARELTPDLILSDMMMPVLDGFGLLRELRADRNLREVPVILLSARAGEEARTEGILAGADDYVTKPFSAKEVVARVETALRLQKIRSEARAQVEAVNAELQRANQDLEQFAYSASHDLQEPLRSVKIYSELLTANCEDQLAGNGSEYLKFVREGASRMEVLLRDMLAYARASRMDAPAERIDAGACLQASLDSLAAAISESGAEITADPLPEVMVHEAHLQQIYQNLIGNAIKYRRTGVVPQIHIAAEAKDAECVFSVRDNGIGIDPEYFNRIFGLFKRLHTKQEYSGTGIGLALCQRIVEHYRGRIWVESQPGSGSTFYFALPV